MENISITAACAYGLGRPQTEQIAAPHGPSAACQLLLLTARLRAGFSHLHTAGPGDATLGRGASSLASRAAGPVALCFPLQSAQLMTNERGLHRRIQILSLFRRRQPSGGEAGLLPLELKCVCFPVRGDECLLGRSFVLLGCAN